MDNKKRQVKPHIHKSFLFLQLDIEVSLMCFSFFKTPKIKAAEYTEICLLNYRSPVPFCFLFWCCSSLSVFTDPAASFSSCSSSLPAFIFLPWNCIFPLTDSALAAFIPFPSNLWPFEFHLFRDSCRSSGDFLQCCFFYLS